MPLSGPLARRQRFEIQTAEPRHRDAGFSTTRGARSPPAPSRHRPGSRAKRPGGAGAGSLCGAKHRVAARKCHEGLVELARRAGPRISPRPRVPIDPLLVPETDDLPPLQQLLEAAKARRPDIAIARENSDIARITAVGSASGLLPNLRLGGSASNSGQTGQAVPGAGPDPYFVGGVGAALGQMFRRNFPNERIGLSFSANLERPGAGRLRHRPADREAGAAQPAAHAEPACRGHLQPGAGAGAGARTLPGGDREPQSARTPARRRTRRSGWPELRPSPAWCNRAATWRTRSRARWPRRPPTFTTGSRSTRHWAALWR